MSKIPERDGSEMPCFQTCIIHCEKLSIEMRNFDATLTQAWALNNVGDYFIVLPNSGQN